MVKYVTLNEINTSLFDGITTIDYVVLIKKILNLETIELKDLLLLITYKLTPELMDWSKIKTEEYTPMELKQTYEQVKQFIPEELYYGMLCSRSLETNITKEQIKHMHSKIIKQLSNKTWRIK